MSYQMKPDEILESLQNCNHPSADAFERALCSLVDAMAVMLAQSQGIVAGRAHMEGVGFAGICVPFMPAYDGQPLPACMADYDDASAWADMPVTWEPSGGIGYRPPAPSWDCYAARDGDVLGAEIAAPDCDAAERLFRIDCAEVFQLGDALAKATAADDWSLFDAELDGFTVGPAAVGGLAPTGSRWTIERAAMAEAIEAGKAGDDVAAYTQELAIDVLGQMLRGERAGNAAAFAMIVANDMLGTPIEPRHGDPAPEFFWSECERLANEGGQA